MHTTSVRHVLRGEFSGRDTFSYPLIPDEFVTPSDNAFMLATICQDNDLLAINNLKTDSKHFVSGKTYKKKNVWISELDVVVTSRQLVRDIADFQVHQTALLPSDHAFVSLEMRLPAVNLTTLCERAGMLGGHGSLMGEGSEVL